ncbi:serine-rich adhesin for platelets-like [Odontomachus brunneus]|uniref:serine-rich adhesin for platelets-like n=1 Tax=Odontomachus brunneus TaxID=486640 RepID=UPI0013F1AF58|nr:serine-rich adhesin for platelets-like [Odontomachus brunneus]
MATDCVDGDYLGAYARFFAEFVARVNPDDQLPVKVSGYDISEGEIVGEIISVTLQYLNQTYCPPSLQSYIVHLVIQAIKSTCKKQPEICGLRQQEKTYAPLKLMQAVTNEVNEICRRYLDNSRLALLPPPSSTPQVAVGATRNARRKMEDRHVVLHDLHTIFNIQDDTIANYYAVFDGHGGQDAAAYCATHLHQYLVESVHYPTDPERALRDAFLTADAQFIAKSSTLRLNGGTTAVCVLVLDKKLYVAWVGDSMASLVKRGCVKQLVNPHRPAREDEQERINNMGGVVVNCVGVLRVNGFLSISRAIGDVLHKPFVSGEPEIRCVPLDGTEDFLIIACDGLWDHVDPRTAAQRVYRQVLQNPHDLKYVQQTLLQCAKRAGSFDNITVIVVFLTPPIEIASRPLNAHPLLSYPAPNGLTLNNMDSNNPFLSNVNGQFDVNAAFVKQQQKLDADLQHENGTDLDLDDNRRLIYGTSSSNGKHVEDLDGNDDYDYGDLGPETDVDAVDDAPDVRAPLERLSRELFPDEKSRRDVASEGDNNIEDDDDEDDDEDEDDEDDLSRDNANIRRTYDADDVMDNRIRGQSNEDVYGADDNVPRDNNDDVVPQPPPRGVVDSDARVTEPDAPVVDDDESPPSPPRAAKPLQHALIPEADNVADSEDSEDEWNYYRIDPNKEESATATRAAAPGDEEKNTRENPELDVKDNSEVQSLEEAADIKCERRTEEETSSELIDTDISDERELKGESERKLACSEEEETQEADMDFQLNPNAAEFVPTAVSPTLLDRRNITDFPISGSPLKQTLVMDDIPVPTQSEFEEEVSHRPREIDEKTDYTNGDHDNLQGLDVSEISSTRAELGDESIARIMATTQQWSAKMRDDGGVGSEVEEYDIATDPMAMSFAPGDFEVAFERGVDLNAVHDLSGADVEGDENECYVPNDNTPPRSPEPEPYANEDRTHTPFMDKSNDLLHASSTPYTDGGTSADLITNEVLTVEQQQTSSIEQELGVSPLTDDLTSEHETPKPEPIASQIDDDHLVAKEQVEEVSESAQSAVSDLLETPNLAAESCAKESSLSSMSPMQDTLECASPQPVEEETVIPSELSPTAAVPVASSLEIDVSKLSQQYDLDPFASDCVSNTNDAPDLLQKPLDSVVPAGRQNVDNLIFEALSTEAVTAAVDQQPQDLWESIVCTKELSLENTETPTNITVQQEETDHKPNTETEETAKLMEYFSQGNEMCEIRAEDMKISTDFSATYENVNATIDSLISDAIVKSTTAPVESSYHEPMLEIGEAPTLANVDMNLLVDFSAQQAQILQNSAEIVGFDSESMFKVDKAAEVTNVSVNMLDDSTQEQQIEKSSAELVDLDSSESKFKDNEEVLTNVDVVETSSIVTSQNDTVVPSTLASVEEQTQDEKIQSLLLDNTPTEALVSSNVPEEPEKEKPIEVTPTSNETLEEKVTAESVSTDKTETAELSADKPKEEIVAAESTTVVIPATATVAAAAAVATAVGAVASSAKVKSAKRPTKTATTTTTTTKTITSTTKAASAKSTPTSPSKAAVSATTARTTSATSAQSAATKKPAAARPKQLDGSAKAAVSNTTTKSSIAAKTATAAKAATTTATKSTASSRVSAVASRPRTINTSITSPKPSTTGGLSDKKSTTANGDAKQLASNKPIAAKSTISKSTTSSSGTKATTLVKSSSTTTRTSVSAVSSKPRPTSASLAVRASTNSSPKPATTSGLNNSMSRPKTAPASSGVTKTRENTAKTSTVKSPMIDKQIKETANKRISLGRSTTGTSSTTAPKTGRASAPAATAAKSRLTSAKLSNTTTATSPTKKTTSKVVASRVSTSAKTTPSNKTKALPNGVPDSTLAVTTDNVITTMMNDKLVDDDDVPRKDASPVNVPTDNQLIVTAD